MIPFLFGVLLFLSLSTPAFADSSILLNEIVPYPASGEKEWLELYNPSAQTQQFSNYKVTEKTSSGNIVSHELPNFSLPTGTSCYYQFTVNSLNNDQDTVSLIDNNGVTIDSYSYQSTIQNKSFARIPDGGIWSAEASPTKTNVCETEPSPTEPTPKLKLSLSEFMPNPNKGDKEWVEIYNDSPLPADISGYQIDDIEGGSTPFIIPSGTSIGGYSFVVINIESKFNNDEDSVRLLNPDNSVIETTSYQSTKEEISFAKNPQGIWVQTTSPTPNSPNQITLPILTNNPTVTQKITSTNPTKNTLTPTPSKTTSKLVSNQSVVLGVQAATNEATREISDIKLSFKDSEKEPEKLLLKKSSYSKYVSYGLIDIGSLVIGIPLLIFIKKKYAS